MSLTIQVATLTILGRLLDPEDFGLVAMASPLIVFIQMFSDFGISTATVQRRTLDGDDVSAMFWVGLGLGFLCALVGVALAPLAAWAYGEPRIETLILVLAIMLPLSALRAQHGALLQREMRFAPVAFIGLSSQMIGSIVAVLAARFGAQYWALVVLQMLPALLAVPAFWYFVDWRPKAIFWTATTRSMLSFSGYLTAFNFLNYFGRNADNIMIGMAYGAAELGPYALAYRLMRLPLDQIYGPLSSVVIPALSRLQALPEEFEKLYLRLLSTVSLVGMPAVAFLAVMADSVVVLVVGEQWRYAATIFSWFAIASIVFIVYWTMGWLLVSTGHAKRHAKWALIAVPAVVVGFAAGLPWGGEGVAAAYAVVTCLLVVPGFRFALRTVPVSGKAMLRAVRPAIMAMAAVAAATVVFRVLAPTLASTLPGLVAASLVALLAYALVLSVSIGPRTLVQQARRLRHMLSQPALP
jgi:PST family polysaccharide transporter